MLSKLPCWATVVGFLIFFGIDHEPVAGATGQDRIDMPPGKSREFTFTYRATVTGLKNGEKARIWLPVPSSNADQRVAIQKHELPENTTFTREPVFNNKMAYVEASANGNGQIPLSITYRVKRFEVGSSAKDSDESDLFLKPDSKVPISGKTLNLLDGKQLPDDPLELGRTLYDVVNNHMRYSKEGTGWGQGDAEWACDSKYGNCSDFHSLFISLARAKKLPAKFEIGFPIPEKRGRGDVAGYHCWAKFKTPSNGWVPVDISEANKNPKLTDYFFGNLTEDRVTFSTGRDINLVPKQDGPPLNFFIYPYVEIAGKPYPADQIERQFSFVDVPDSR